MAAAVNSRINALVDRWTSWLKKRKESEKELWWMQWLITSESKDTLDWGEKSICETQMYSDCCLIIAITILKKDNKVQGRQ